MSALRGPGDFTPDDPDERVSERAEELQTELREDAKQLAAIDCCASEQLDSAQYESLFAVLADAEDSGLVHRLASGDPLTALQAKHLDVFARVARIAKDMAAAREAGLTEAARTQAERESAGWPQWRGTAAATQHYARRDGGL